MQRTEVYGDIRKLKDGVRQNGFLDMDGFRRFQSTGRIDVSISQNKTGLADV